MEICFKIDGNGTSIPEDIAKSLVLILNNQTKIMALIDELKTQVTDLQTQVTDLQTTVDAEQAQIQQLLETNAQVVTDLNTQIANLNAQIAAGATPEQLQELSASLTTIKDSIATTKSDIEGTVQDNTTLA